MSAQTPPENVRNVVEAINDFRKGDRPYEGLVETGERLWKDNSATKIEGGTQVQGADLGPALDDNIRPLMDEIHEDILDYDNDPVEELVAHALEQDIEPDIILDNSLIRTMDTVGEEFATGELFVPEMLMAANAMKSGLEIFRPILTERKTKSKGTVVLATVQGDLHDIGKNLVAMLLEGGEFEVFDVGVNAAPDKIMAEAEPVTADIVGLSALLTTSMPFMGNTVTAIKEAGNTYPAIVGGAPVSQGFANKIGADGYAESAVDAVVLAKRLMAAAESAQRVSA
ncbi:MAG: corrinoid protein [Rhizobiaceae bacterium]|nr:corrinoid protein [Rhizobiaceae bacterium]